MTYLLKKLMIIIGVATVLTLTGNSVFAADPAADLGLLPQGNTPLDEPTSEDTDEILDSEELKAFRELPDLKTTDNVIATAVKLVLRFTMLLTLIAIVVAGVFYIISEGDDEKTKKAKDIILYLVIGMAIISASYGIVSGISSFKFLE